MEANQTMTPARRAGLRRAMMMATLAAVLALGGVLGLHPRIAEATPKRLGRATPAAAPAAAPVAVPEGGAAPPETAATEAARASPVDDSAADEPEPSASASASRGGKRVSGKLNLNTASAEQLVLLPGIGPAKAERVVTWRKRNGTFRRVADLRRVKGFGYRTLKKLEAFLDVKGDTTLRAGP